MSPEERREQIIAGAIAFFTERGFEGTTRELSERLGVTQPLLYQYFPTKRDLIDAVYDRVYLRRLKPHWTALIIDRQRPIAERMTQFYVEYSDAVLTREWVRLFVFAGLQGEDLNHRYLRRLERVIMLPLLDEITVAARAVAGAKAKGPSLDDLWAHHGGIFYFGIREHIYGLGAPHDRRRSIVDAVSRFLQGFIELPASGHKNRSGPRDVETRQSRAVPRKKLSRPR